MLGEQVLTPSRPRRRDILKLRCRVWTVCHAEAQKQLVVSEDVYVSFLWRLFLTRNFEVSIFDDPKDVSKWIRYRGYSNSVSDILYFAMLFRTEFKHPLV